MLSLTQNIIIAVVVMALTLLFMAAVNRYRAVKGRYEHEDMVGWQLNVLATTHAVILGFMLYTVWTNFTDVSLNVELEASALRNLYRLAEGLPEPARSRLDAQVKAYADAVISEDWPVLARGGTPEKSHLISQQMWRTLISVREGSAAELAALDHALSELSAMTEHRRTRLLQASNRLPVVLWWVLLVGGVLTIASVAMFGSRNRLLHAFQVFSLTLLITLSLLAIADLNRPFHQGWVHADVYPFERAREHMNQDIP
ncbi:MAG TPA: DUF4239 domain-containing protein [Steroidobacteraceae bacterium]|nr:DUF4239 domain-containing protein [Steroidobacteraceae bacterium]